MSHVSFGGMAVRDMRRDASSTIRIRTKSSSFLYEVATYEKVSKHVLSHFYSIFVSDYQHTFYLILTSRRNSFQTQISLFTNLVLIMNSSVAVAELTYPKFRGDFIAQFSRICSDTPPAPRSDRKSIERSHPKTSFAAVQSMLDLLHRRIAGQPDRLKRWFASTNSLELRQRSFGHQRFPL
jgi:hypothetical protein